MQNMLLFRSDLVASSGRIFLFLLFFSSRFLSTGHDYLCKVDYIRRCMRSDFGVAGCNGMIYPVVKFCTNVSKRMPVVGITFFGL
ncbi:MAG: hypothetical protein FD123_60 [Bacteroidetes bacterium]|nr:MAG: hypothetical protein FD123_60 [Bacteroidota bacterium]